MQKRDSFIQKNILYLPSINLLETLGITYVSYV